MHLQDTTERLIARLIKDPTAESGRLGNELLSRLFSEGSYFRVLELLGHSNPDVTLLGAWLASELGEQVASIYDRVRLFLDHPSATVRFFLTDCVLNCAASAASGEDIAKVAMWIGHDDQALRWKIMGFPARLPDSAIEAAIAQVGQGPVPSGHVEGMRALVTPCSRPTVQQMLRSGQELRRRYGCVAAARSGAWGRELLSTSLQGLSMECACFVRSWLALHR